MIKPTLLFTITLFLAACSDNAAEKQLLPSSKTKEVSAPVKVTPHAETQTQNSEIKTEHAEPTSTKEEPAINGRVLYTRKCASCHGKNGEKAALNKSQVISGWETQQTANALKGYQDGSYGSNMKGIMKGQVSALSDAQIQAVSEYIATL